MFSPLGTLMFLKTFLEYYTTFLDSDIKTDCSESVSGKSNPWVLICFSR